ncbi:MAG: hypothetical protein WAP27_00325, partial [Tepidanaerobacteraceae bacterium]
MNTIVIQNCINFINKILSFMSEPKIKKLEELEIGLEAITDNFLLNMTQTYIESYDKEIKADKKWRKEN